MIKNLGKILILLTIAVDLTAKVDIKVNPPAIYKGESINIVISADGDDILFPEIDQIEDSIVESTSTSKSTTIINGDVTKRVSKIYTISPKKSFKLPRYKVVVDGKEYKTDRVEVTVLKPSSNRGSNQEFIVESLVDKREAFVGEAIELTLVFKQKIDAKAAKIELQEPSLENFWIKKVGDVTKSRDRDYIVQKIKYLLFAQKSGKYTIPSISADIAKVTKRGSSMFNDPFFDDPFFNSFSNTLKWSKIFSDEIEIDIKPLANNLEIYGDFNISATVDKSHIKANKPINLTVKVDGIGNIDDIKKFNLDIDEAVVYSDEPVVSSYFKDGKYGGEFKQSMAIIADQNYTIPPIRLTFVDSKSSRVKSIETKPIDIEVVGGRDLSSNHDREVQVDSSSIDKDVVQNQTTDTKNYQNSYIKYLFLAIGLFFGALLHHLYIRVKRERKSVENSVVKSIKKAKSDRELFNILLPYSKDSMLISTTLQKLEENIYKNGSNRVDKDELIEFFELDTKE